MIEVEFTESDIEIIKKFMKTPWVLSAQRDLWYMFKDILEGDIVDSPMSVFPCDEDIM